MNKNDNCIIQFTTYKNANIRLIIPREKEERTTICL